MSVNTHIFGGLPSLMANFEYLTDVSHLTDDELSEMAERAGAAVSECAFIMETVGRLLDRMARLPVHEQELGLEQTARLSYALMSEIGGAMCHAADILADIAHQQGYRDGHKQAVLDMEMERKQASNPSDTPS